MGDGSVGFNSATDMSGKAVSQHTGQDDLAGKVVSHKWVAIPGLYRRVATVGGITDIVGIRNRMRGTAVAMLATRYLAHVSIRNIRKLVKVIDGVTLRKHAGRRPTEANESPTRWEHELRMPPRLGAEREVSKPPPLSLR